MSDKMDRGLDEIIADTVRHYHPVAIIPCHAIFRSSCTRFRLKPTLTDLSSQRSNRPRNNNNNRGQGRRREPRNDFPRDGVRKVCKYSVPASSTLRRSSRGFVDVAYAG
jgi:hypothetical protein